MLYTLQHSVACCFWGFALFTKVSKLLYSIATAFVTIRNTFILINVMGVVRSLISYMDSGFEL